MFNAILEGFAIGMLLLADMVLLLTVAYWLYASCGRAWLKAACGKVSGWTRRVFHAANAS